MKEWILAILSVPVLMCPVPGRKVKDWRIDLLTQEGIGLDKESLKKALIREKKAAPEVAEIYRRLSSSRFADREKAQKELENSGAAGLEWLRRQGVPEGPEMKARVEEVIERLEFQLNPRKVRETALNHAVRTLLADGDERGGETGGRFYEWFGTEEEEIDGEYRQFVFRDQVQRGAKVKGGTLVFPGEKVVDGDQSLVLKSGEWPGAESFGSEFKVSVSLGAKSDQGTGAWHLGISIGNVKALYHPGMAGGAFRFETVRDHRYLSQSESMGFNPEGGVMQWMTVKVSQLSDERIRLKVSLEEGGLKGGRFQKEIIVSQEDIGDLDEIGLERSGRAGGAALFRDFEVRLIE